MKELNIEISEDFFKSKASIGEIREWRGIRYQKQTDGSWKPLKKGKVLEGEKMRQDDSYYGRNFYGYQGNPKEAILRLLKEKKGQIRSVWKRDDIGSIDIVWGESWFGLKHILEKHKENERYQDFDNDEHLATEIENLLKEGKIVRSYKDKNGYGKKDISLGKHKIVISETPVYDDEDNFSTKHWIVTSYDPTTKPGEKNIRKATSEDIAFEKELDCYKSLQSLANSRKNYSREDEPNVRFCGGNSLSESKDKTFQSTLQQIEEINLLKAKKGSPLGAEKEWGGKIYIKTTNGWRPKSKKSSKQEDDSGNKSQKSEEEDSKKGSSLEEHTSKASDKQLEAATKDKAQSEEIKTAAQKELEKRKEDNKAPKEENDDKKSVVLEHLKKSGLNDDQIKSVMSLLNIDDAYENLKSNEKEKKEKTSDVKIDERFEELKEEMTKQIEEKFKEQKGFKKITQTYVKIGDDNVVINMKDENKYKAKKGSFYMESEIEEPLADFKKRVKEEYEKKEQKPQPKEGPIKEEPKSGMPGPIKEEPTTGIDEPFYKDKEKRGNFIMSQIRASGEKEIQKYIDNLEEMIQPDKLKTQIELYEEEIPKYEKNYKSLSSGESFISTVLDQMSADLYDDNEIALNIALVKQGYRPVLTSAIFSEYKEESYRNDIMTEQEFERELQYEFDDESAEKESMEFYSGEEGYTYMNGYLQVKKEGRLSEIEDSPYWKNIGVTRVRNQVENLQKLIKNNPLRENISLNRRMDLDSKDLVKFYSMEVGDTFVADSFQSYSTKSHDSFGNDLNLCLLARKGQKVLPIDGMSNGETEYLVQSGSKFRVLQKGTGSLLIEIVD